MAGRGEPLVSARASRGFVRRGRLEGLHLRATDLDWSPARAKSAVAGRMTYG
jgi:hypothetical protein